MVERIININLPINNIFPKTVCCIGNFDGMHIGHRKLIKETIKIAENSNCKSGLILFNIDVHNYFSKDDSVILDINQRCVKAIELGIDYVYVLNFDDIKDLEFNDFINDVLKRLNVQIITCGKDFKFGKDGKGNIFNLMNLIPTHITEDVNYFNKKVSSSNIKKLIKDNNIELAGKMLGKIVK